METDAELTNALIDVYRRAGQEVGYWSTRFLQAVRRNGGFATAKRMLKPRNTNQRAGLDALLKANRPDLTLEAIILQPKFQKFFTESELAVAKERLGKYGEEAAMHKASRERLFPDELEAGRKYFEGARKQVRVNAYERDARARKACLKHYGYDCCVCGMNFEAKYGTVGKEFIHVHHLKPLALLDEEYQLDPITDLQPVCPNCHAMLHRGDTVLTIEELKSILK
jgi:5-methylcytosine-specific restriction enzyme A